MASRTACRGYKYRRIPLIILLVFTDDHTLADLHHPRWDLNTSQGPDSKRDNRHEDQESNEETGDDGRRKDLDSLE